MNKRGGGEITWCLGKTFQNKSEKNDSALAKCGKISDKYKNLRNGTWNLHQKQMKTAML